MNRCLIYLLSEIEENTLPVENSSCTHSKQCKVLGIRYVREDEPDRCGPHPYRIPSLVKKQLQTVGTARQAIANNSLIGMNTMGCGRTWEDHAKMPTTVSGSWYLFIHLFIYQIFVELLFYENHGAWKRELIN